MNPTSPLYTPGSIIMADLTRPLINVPSTLPQTFVYSNFCAQSSLASPGKGMQARLARVHVGLKGNAVSRIVLFR